MTMTIELPPDIEAALQADAKAQGRKAEEIVVLQLAARYAPEDDLDEALEEAFTQMEAGQGQPFEEFAAELRARFDDRHAPVRHERAKAA